VEHVLDCGCVHSGRSDFHGDAPGAEGLGLETVVLQFVGYFSKDGLLGRGQFENDWHEQALAFHFLCHALPQDAFEQDSLMGYVLVDDPEAIFVYCEDKRIADLSQRAEGGERGQR
jgi:hypothetical protein